MILFFHILYSNLNHYTYNYVHIYLCNTAVSFFTLGQRLGALDLEGNTPPECQEFINEVNNFFDSTTKLLLSVPTYMIYRNKQWKYSVNSQRAVKDLAMKFISKRLDEIKEEDKQLLQQAADDEAPVKVDFLTYLVHSGKMSLDAITANVIDLMTAGVDTVCYLYPQSSCYVVRH